MKDLVIQFVAYTSATVKVPDDFNPETDMTDEIYDEAWSKVDGEYADWKVDETEEPELS